MNNEVKLRTILIGLGSIATHYAKGLLNSAIYDLKYICDINNNASARNCFGSAVEFVNNYTLITRSNKVDVAIIATPPHTHDEIIRECHKNNILPIVEKPLCYNLFELDKLNSLGKEFRTMFHWQYSSEMVWFMENEFPKIDHQIDYAEINIRDSYLDENGHISSAHINKGGCWLDSGVNALSLLSMVTDLSHCKIKHFTTEEDDKSSQPRKAYCEIHNKRSKFIINLQWSNDGTDEKMSILQFGENRYSLNHSEQSVSLNGKVIYLQNNELHRLDNHYINLFAQAPEKLCNKTEITKIHSLLFKPLSHKKQTIIGTLSRYSNHIAELLISHNRTTITAIYSIAIIAMIILSHYVKNAILGEILKNAVAFLVSIVFFNMCKFIFQTLEDRKKVAYNNDILEKMYSNAYLCNFIINGTACKFYYDECWGSKGDKEYEFIVMDDPSKQFELTDFIKNHKMEILKAHENSHFVNMDTVRLDDYEVSESGQNTLKLITSRSTYISHLATNRAVDFIIADIISLRQKYEYRPTLTPLKHSVFSNHIGIIGMVILNDNYTLLPHRSSTSTISKNMITSSIAMPLLPDISIVDKSTTNGTPFESYIRKSLPSAIKVHDNFLKDTEVTIKIIGLGRDVYEGGKPSCFYLINIDKSSTEYLEAKSEHLKHGEKEKAFDNNKEIYVVPYNSIKWQENGELLIFNTQKSDGVFVEKFARPERNLLCNLYHIEKCKAR